MGKVLNENLDYANGAKEGLHFREVFAGTPVDNFVNSRRVGDLAFQGANVPYNGNLSHTQEGLLTGEGSPTILHTLDDMVEVLKVLPDEVVDPDILQDGFEGAIGGLVCHGRATNGHIVDIGYGVLGNLQLKDVCHIIVEDGYSVGPTHQEFGQMEHTIWCSKGGVVVRCFSKCAFVVADKKVKHSSASTTCELLSNLFRERSDAGVLDHDGVEGFETVDWVNGIGFFLHYAEPARVVQRVGALVYTGIHLHLNNFANFVIDTQWYWNDPLNPGGVCDDQDFNRWKEVFVEMTVLGIVLSESFILEQHEVM